MNENSVLVSIINWNNSVATNRCIRSMVDQTIKCSIMVTDNNSEIEEFNLEDDLKATVTLTKNKTNLGYAGAHNLAIEYAAKNNFKYILLMNNDAYFNSSKDLSRLIDCAINNDADATAPLIVREDDKNKVWFGGGRMDIKKARTQHLYLNQSIDEVPREVVEVSFLTGCTILLKINGIKPLDEDYFLYWEDADWCADALYRGKKIIFCPTAVAVHNISSSLGARSPLYAYYNIRNRLIFARRWSGAQLPLIFISNIYLSLKYLVLTLLNEATKLPKMFLYLGRAQIDGLLRKSGPV